MKEVTFVRHNAPYVAGETASFSDERAGVFVKAGVAVYPPSPVEKSMPPVKTGVVKTYSKKS